MGITEQQNKIFNELRKINPGIIDDGVVDETEYTSALYRIMYVLKEVNGGFGWSLCKHLKNGGRQQVHDATWDNIARWTEGILSLPNELAWSQLENACEKRRERMLPKICAVNVKKTAGSYTSDSKQIYVEALNNAEILKKQLELYSPHIVICCGTEKAFVEACYPKQRIKWQMTTRGVWYFMYDSKIIISFSHPAARVKDCYLYYALMDAVREILKMK